MESTRKVFNQVEHEKAERKRLLISYFCSFFLVTTIVVVGLGIKCFFEHKCNITMSTFLVSKKTWATLSSVIFYAGGTIGNLTSIQRTMGEIEKATIDFNNNLLRICYVLGTLLFIFGI